MSAEPIGARTFDTLAPQLAAHVRQQRWFGDKHRSIAAIDVTAADVLRSTVPGLVRARLEVGFADGEPAAYQLLLGLRPPEEARPLVQGRPQALVGELATPDGVVAVYDALVDPQLGLLLLELVAPGRRAAAVRRLAVEQSNSSLVYDDAVILKVFRRLRPGGNPEVEIVEALSGGDFKGVPELLGVWRHDGYDLAIAQRFLDGGEEGWALATRSAAAMADFTAEAAALGTTTAELHRALVGALGVGPAEPGRWAAEIGRQLEMVDHPDLDRASATAVLDRLGRVADAGSAIRVHGDYHLGQVMRTAERWFVLDFEGEPARDLAQRRRPTSPLRDVAGMLRSFHYASAMAPTGRGWEARCRASFLDSYIAAADTSLLPAGDDDRAAVQAAFELEKAVYEVGYEQAHRPEWVGIPVEAVRRLSHAR